MLLGQINDDAEDLARMFHIFKGILFLNDTAIFEMLLSDGCVQLPAAQRPRGCQRRGRA